ncbi:hypothetical protein [Acidipila sp. EB88]|uniref:hypothetical protein n=1 Tax=Acidipila sp. EB88 TaxID=2305226 RepID=UPI000F5DDB29|nr:hypothetical protein [Acidipila sp. EB88]RRA49422.1 hypothetical protein D1Y84_15195 [Acidipila sp. EB88]
MTFTVTHARAFVGTDLTVHVVASDKDSIASVAIVLDGMTLEELELGSGTDDYTRSFAGVGRGEPGMDHVLVVTVLDGSGVTHGSTTRWSDQ